MQKIGILDLNLIKLLQNGQGCNFLSSQCTLCDLIGLAIHWGAVGDVGAALNLLADNDTAIVGTLSQRISSCLTTLDQLLRQPHTIVSSFVPAHVTRGITDTSSTDSLRDVVARIIGMVE